MHKYSCNQRRAGINWRMPSAPVPEKRGRPADVERHEQARVERLEFAAYLDRLKAECGIERKKVAELMAIGPDQLSKLSAAEVKRQPTLAPSPDALAALAVKLEGIAGNASSIASDLARAATARAQPTS